MHFLVWTSVKMDLIMNSLALVFIFELDNLVYSASVALLKQKFIAGLQPIKYKATMSKQFIKTAKLAMPIVVTAFIAVLAIAVRYYQLQLFGQVYDTASTLCLFGGPTPGGRADL